MRPSIRSSTELDAWCAGTPEEDTTDPVRLQAAKRTHSGGCAVVRAASALQKRPKTMPELIANYFKTNREHIRNILFEPPYWPDWSLRRVFPTKLGKNTPCNALEPVKPISTQNTSPNESNITPTHMVKIDEIDC